MKPDLTVTVKDGRVFTNGGELTKFKRIEGAKVQGEGFSFEYRDTMASGKHIAAFRGNEFIGPHKPLKADGTYKFTVVLDKMQPKLDSPSELKLADGLNDKTVMYSRLYCRCWYECPIELETNPVKLALRKHGINLGRSVMQIIGKDEPMLAERSTYGGTMPSGVKELDFITDGTDAVSTDMSYNDNLPMSSKVVGATFTIQYSTRVDRKGNIRRWIERILIRDNPVNVRPLSFDDALEQIMDITKRPEVFITRGSADPEPGQTTALGAALEAALVA